MFPVCCLMNDLNNLPLFYQITMRRGTALPGCKTCLLEQVANWFGSLIFGLSYCEF